jgi:hypothetical protein
MVSEPGGNGKPAQEGKPPNRRPIIIRIFRGLKRYEHRRRRRAQQEKSDRDLIMARWTRRVGIFTAALVAVSIATAGIFWRQLNVMQGQLDEMQNASGLTQESNKINREAFTAVQRAFISVSGIDVRRGLPGRYIGGTPEYKFWVMLPKIENSGTTSTRNLRWAIRTVIELDPNKTLPQAIGESERTEPIRNEQWNYGVLGPKAAMTLDYAARTGIKDDQISGIGRGLFRFLFTGVILYKDVFSGTAEHVTKFCYAMGVDPGPDPSRPVYGTPFGTQCGGHTNCADDECENRPQ